MLDELMRQITGLKLENAQAKEWIRCEQDTNKKQKEKMEKLDKFYQKQKNKKYRNCGSQAYLDVNTQRRTESTNKKVECKENLDLQRN